MPQFDDETVGEWRITWTGNKGAIVGSVDDAYPDPLTLIAEKEDGSHKQEVALEGLSPLQVEEKLLPLLKGETHDFIRRHGLNKPEEYGGIPD